MHPSAAGGFLSPSTHLFRTRTPGASDSISLMDRQMVKTKIMSPKYVTLIAIVAMFLIAVATYQGLWERSKHDDDILFIYNSGGGDTLPNKTQIASVQKDKLERTLEGASLGNKTIIISVLNKAYTDEGGMFDLFLRSFHLGINTSSFVDHILFLAVDSVSYEICVSKHLHCYDLATEGDDFSDEMLYMSNSYLNMLWRKTHFLIQVLKRGYSFLFTDMDIVWLRNPFERLEHDGDDFQFMCDRYVGRPYSTTNSANIGLYFVVSNNKTISLFETLYAARNQSRGMKQQDILKGMKQRGVFRDRGLKVRYLDVRYFAGFCSNPRKFDEVRTVHANCCRGIKAKLADLSLVLDEWEMYKNGTATRRKLRWPEHRECRRSWKTT